MAKINEQHEFVDNRGRVRIVINGRPSEANDTTRVLLRPNTIVLGPPPAPTPEEGGTVLEGLADRYVTPVESVNPDAPILPPEVSIKIGGEGTRGVLVLYDSRGNQTIRVDGERSDIALLGADCAEDFEIDGDEPCELGSVMVIADGARLRVSSETYDRKVAGVLSGAGAHRPGVVLGRRGGPGQRLPLALSGRVYCKADATHAPIAVGDLLTTSAFPGHAMKAEDPQRAFGAVIGKALASLTTGRGLLPVLVALQ